MVIAPTVQEGSQVETDWKVELKGLDELPAYLVTERSSEIDLSEEEMLAIPELLHCTRWNEVNSLLAGVLPRWDETPSDPTVAAPVMPASRACPRTSRRCDAGARTAGHARGSRWRPGRGKLRSRWAR